MWPRYNCKKETSYTLTLVQQIRNLIKWRERLIYREKTSGQNKMPRIL